MCTEHIAVVLLWSLVDCLVIYFSGSQCTFLVYCTVCVCVFHQLEVVATIT